MRFKNLSFLLVAPLMLASCGDDSASKSGGSTGASGSTITSQFIDAPVKGLGYRTASMDPADKDVTKDQGYFNCVAGENVTFFVKDLEIGEARCGEKIYISELEPTTEVDNTDFAAALIQSLAKVSGNTLDLEDANNDIDIKLSTVDFNGMDNDTFESVLGGVLTSNYTLKTVSEAKEHVLENLPAPSNTALLDSILGDETSKTQFVQLTLNARNEIEEEDCYPRIWLKVQLDKVSGQNKTAFKLSIPEATFMAESESDFDQNCSNGICKTEISPKFIAGNAVSFYKYFELKTLYSKDDYEGLCELHENEYYPWNSGRECPVDLVAMTKDLLGIESSGIELNVNFSASGIKFSMTDNWRGEGNSYSRVGNDFVSLKYSGACYYTGSIDLE